MSRTVVLAFAKKDDADAMAVNYADDHTVMVIGPTDQVMLARGTEDGSVWRSGPDADLFLLVATKDTIAGPRKAGG